jgi:hypothetical protein
MLDRRALFGIQGGIGIGKCGIGNVGRRYRAWERASLDVAELYIYPVDLRKPNCGQLIQISTKSVHNRVEKHPLDPPEASQNAAFNNLPIAGVQLAL